MKIFSLTFLLLISNCQCGLIDGVFGAVSNTTHDIAHNVGGIFSFGQGLVFGEKKNKGPTEAGIVKHTKGLLGGLFDSVHDNVRNLEESIKSVFTIKYTKVNGVLENMSDRVKNRVLNIKNFIFGSIQNPRETVNKTYDNLKDKTKPIRDHINKFIFGNKTKNNNLNDMMKVLDEIKRKLNDIHNKGKTETKRPDFEEKPKDGTGLIDVRSSFVDIKEQSENFAKRNDVRYDHGRYDMSDVAKQRGKLKNNVETSISDIESNVKNSLDRNKQVMDVAQKKINDDVFVFRE